MKTMQETVEMTEETHVERELSLLMEMTLEMEHELGSLTQEE